MLGLTLALTERPEEAIAAIDEAVRLSPDDPERFRWEHYRAVAHFAAGRYQEARDAEQFALSFNANDSFNTRACAYQMLAASLAHLGELKEARSALEQAVRLRPALTLEVAGVWLRRLQRGAPRALPRRPAPRGPRRRRARRGRRVADEDGADE